MKSIRKHQKLSIFSFILALILIVLGVHAIPRRGVIRVIFQPTQRSVQLPAITDTSNLPLSVMTIHPDGHVFARAGDGVLLFGAIPVFPGVSERKETTISQEDYEFLMYVMRRRDRPNLRKDTSNRRNTDAGFGWLLRTSTTTRRYAFYGAFPVFCYEYNITMRNIIDEFTDKLYIVNPFELIYPAPTPTTYPAE